MWVGSGRERGGFRLVHSSKRVLQGLRERRNRSSVSPESLHVTRLPTRMSSGWTRTTDEEGRRGSPQGGEGVVGVGVEGTEVRGNVRLSRCPSSLSPGFTLSNT